MIKNQLEVIGMYKGNVFKEYSVSTTKQSDYIVKKQLQIPFKIENSGFHRLGHVPEIIGDFQPMTNQDEEKCHVLFIKSLTKKKNIIDNAEE